MKFLLTATPRPVPPPPALIDEAKRWVLAQVQSGVADCCYGYVTGGGVAIVNADSHEDAMKHLLEYPLYGFAEFTIQPLCDAAQSYDLLAASVRRATGANA